MQKEAFNKCDTLESSSIIFEGMTSIRAVIKAIEAGSDRRIIDVFYDSAKKEARFKEILYLKSVSEKYSFTISEKDGDFLSKLTLGKSHGGIIAVCTKKTYPKLTPSDIEKSAFYIMIEGVEDPYNFGYCLRTVYASGASGVILSERNWMSAAGIVCRSSAGASELIPSYVSDPLSACEIFKASGYKIICAGIRNSISAFDADLSKPLLLIIGGEKRGISRAVLQMADAVVKLDYGRKFMGSLSTASSASILAYEVFRQNRNR